MILKTIYKDLSKLPNRQPLFFQWYEGEGTYDECWNILLRVLDEEGVKIDLNGVYFNGKLVAKFGDREIDLKYLKIIISPE